MLFGLTTREYILNETTIVDITLTISFVSLFRKVKALRFFYLNCLLLQAEFFGVFKGNLK